MRKIILILALLLLPSFASINNSLVRAPIIVDSILNVSGYHLILNITYTGFSKEDFSDILFTDTSKVLLPFWIKNKVDSQWAEVWVKTNITTLNETQLYIYEGDVDATSQSNLTKINAVYWHETDNSKNISEYWQKTRGAGTFVQDTDGSLKYTSSGSYDTVGAKWLFFEAQNPASFNTITEFKSKWNREDLNGNTRVGFFNNSFFYENWFMYYPESSQEHFRIRSYNGTLYDENIDNIPSDANQWYNFRGIVNSSGAYFYLWDNSHSYSIRRELKYALLSGDEWFGIEAGSNYNGYITYFNNISMRKYISPEPISYIGEFESLSPIGIVAEPISPNVYELINFTASPDLLNPIIHWWDFGDETSIISTTSNKTTHSYSKGGNYLVNLTVSNQTGINISISKYIIVFEPTITIWANDSSNDILISNFSVLAENSTTSKQFNSSGFSATWNFTLGPFGNVSILILKDGYNSTREYITISNSSDINFTATVLPSIYRFYPKDVDYGNTIVPVTISMHNLTSIIEKESDWEKIFSHTNTQNGIGTSVTYSDNYTGQIWKIYAKSTSSETSATVNVSFFLFSQDLSFSKMIFSSVALGVGNDFEKTRYVFLKKDGTYKILDESQVVESSGAFPYFPAKIGAKNYAHIASGGNICSAKSEISQPNEYLEFQQPNDALVGNVSVDFQQLTDGYFGFLENTYSNNKLSFRRVTTRNFFNQTVYLLFTSASKEVKVSTVDRGENAISDTLVVFSIFREGSWKVFASGVTDGTGIVKFKLDQDETYLVTLAHSGYSPQAFTITQPESEYKFYLSDQFNFFDSPLDNLGISLTPFDTSLYSNNSYWFNYTVVDGNLQTDYIKLDLFDENETLLFSDTSSGNPNGGVISTYLTVTNQTRIFANMSVKQFSEDEITITREYIVFDVNVSVISLSSILPDFQDANSSSGWYIIVLILTMILSALHPLIGIAFLFVLVFAHVLELYIAIVGLFAVIGGIVIKGGI